MTGEQIAVVVLLAIAFSAGWVARGATGEEEEGGEDLLELLEHARGALDRTLTAAHATVAMWRAEAGTGESAGVTAARILGAELATLRELAGEAAEQLGADNPIAVDLDQAKEAAGLVERELRGYLAGEPLDEERGRLLDACEGAFRDARMRFVRESEVVRELLAG